MADSWVGHEEKRGRSRLWSVFVVTATVSLLVAPVTMAIGESVRGIRPWDLFAPTAAIGIGIVLTPLAFSYWLVLHPPHKYPGRAAGQLIANPNVHR